MDLGTVIGFLVMMVGMVIGVIVGGSGLLVYYDLVLHLHHASSGRSAP